MRWMFWILAIVGTASACPAWAGPPDPGVQEAIERLVFSYATSFNQQDAAGVAAQFTKDGVLVSQASPAGAVFVGSAELAQRYNGLFNAGVNHIEITISRVEQLGPDAAITWGEYHITGQGQSGPFKVYGDWSATDVRDAGVWKIRLLNAIPKPAPPATR